MVSFRGKTQTFTSPCSPATQITTELSMHSQPSTSCVSRTLEIQSFKQSSQKKWRTIKVSRKAALTEKWSHRHSTFSIQWLLPIIAHLAVSVVWFAGDTQRRTSVINRYLESRGMYRDGQKNASQVLWIWGEKLCSPAYSRQEGTIFFTSY